MANKTVTNFSGGMNVKASPLVIKDSESELILNYHLDTVGSLTKRNGYTTFLNQPNASKNINGLYQFTDIGSATPTTHIMVQNNAGDTAGVIHYRTIGTAATWNVASSIDTASSKTRFTTFLGYVFRVNGANTPLSSADAITWSTVNIGDKLTGTTLTITPKYLGVFQDRLYFANGGGATTTSRLWFSSLPATINALNGAIAIGATTITVDSTTGFLDPGGNGTGTIVIEGDVINYTDATATTFTGCTGVDSAHPDNAFVYQYSGGTGQLIAWDTATNYVDINPDDADEITALENNGNRLLVFKYDALYRWAFGQVEPDRLIGVGTSSQESVKTDFERGITFFANRHGVYAYTGGRPKRISRKIEKWITAVSNWQEVYGGLDTEHYYLSVGNVTVDGVTYTNTMFVYHIALDAWTIYTMNTPVRFMASRRNSNTLGSIKEEVMFGSNDGRVYVVSTSTIAGDDSPNGVSTPIQGQIISKEYMLTFPGNMKIKNVDVIANTHTAVNVSLKTVKGHNPLLLGKLNDRVTNLPGNNIETRSAQLVITDNSADASIIEGWNIEYETLARSSDRNRRSNYPNL